MNAETLNNADDLELQKFGDLAHKWWDINSEFKPLHEINPLRLNWIDGLAPLKGCLLYTSSGRFDDARNGGASFKNDRGCQ